DTIRKEGHVLEPPLVMAKVDTRADTSWGRILRVLFIHHRRRAILGFVLMVAQAFAYNGVFFTYPLVLGLFYGVSAAIIGLYLLPFSLGNLFGPLILGPLFDRIGRRTMIAATYATTGILLAVSGLAFATNVVSSTQLTAMWCLVFFFASAAASSAY